MDLGYYCTHWHSNLSFRSRVPGGLEETVHFEHVHDVEEKLGFFANAKGLYISAPALYHMLLGAELPLHQKFAQQKHLKFPTIRYEFSVLIRAHIVYPQSCMQGN